MSSNAGKKKFVNENSVDLNVTLYVRKGSNVSETISPTTTFFLGGNGGDSFITYGSSSDPYLNGISFVADEGTNVASDGEWVGAKGDQYDKLLNDYDTLTFTNLTVAGLKGSNTWTT